MELLNRLCRITSRILLATYLLLITAFWLTEQAVDIRSLSIDRSGVINEAERTFGRSINVYSTTAQSLYEEKIEPQYRMTFQRFQTAWCRPFFGVVLVRPRSLCFVSHSLIVVVLSVFWSVFEFRLSRGTRRWIGSLMVLVLLLGIVDSIQTDRRFSNISGEITDTTTIVGVIVRRRSVDSPLASRIAAAHPSYTGRMDAWWVTHHRLWVFRASKSRFPNRMRYWDEFLTIVKEGPVPENWGSVAVDLLDCQTDQQSRTLLQQFRAKAAALHRCHQPSNP